MHYAAEWLILWNGNASVQSENARHVCAIVSLGRNRVVRGFDYLIVRLFGLTWILPTCPECYIIFGMCEHPYKLLSYIYSIQFAK